MNCMAVFKKVNEKRDEAKLLDYRKGICPCELRDNPDDLGIFARTDRWGWNAGRRMESMSVINYAIHDLGIPGGQQRRPAGQCGV